MESPPLFLSCSISGLRLDGFDLDLDVDLFTDEHTARLEGLVPLEAPVRAVDRRPADEAYARVAPGVLAASRLFHVEHGLLGHAVDGEVARHLEVSLAGPFDALALERDRRELLDVEEVGRLEVAVALRFARVDARRVDRNVDRRLRRISFVEG